MFVDVNLCECNYTHLHIIPSVVMDVVHHVSRCVDEHLVVETTNVLHHVIVVSVERKRGGGGGGEEIETEGRSPLVKIVPFSL